MNVFGFLQGIDRRLIYALLALTIIIPLVKPVPLPMAISPETQDMWDYISGLPDGGVLWVGGDYSAASATELTPPGQICVRKAFEKGMKVILYSMWQTGAVQNHGWLKAIADEMGKQYGVDWVDLGWKPQSLMTLRGMTDDIITAAGDADFNGAKLADMPLIQTCKALKPEYVAGILDLSSGDPGATGYVSSVIEPVKLTMVVACTAVSSPGFMPYLRAGQFSGMSNGLSGAAELETLAKAPGKATSGIGAQAFAHALIILLVVAGNVGYLAKRRAG